MDMVQLAASLSEYGKTHPHGNQETRFSTSIKRNGTSTNDHYRTNKLKITELANHIHTLATTAGKLSITTKRIAEDRATETIETFLNKNEVAGVEAYKAQIHASEKLKIFQNLQITVTALKNRIEYKKNQIDQKITNTFILFRPMIALANHWKLKKYTDVIDKLSTSEDAIGRIVTLQNTICNHSNAPAEHCLLKEGEPIPNLGANRYAIVKRFTLFEYTTQSKALALLDNLGYKFINESQMALKNEFAQFLVDHHYSSESKNTLSESNREEFNRHLENFIKSKSQKAYEEAKAIFSNAAENHILVDQAGLNTIFYLLDSSKLASKEQIAAELEKHGYRQHLSETDFNTFSDFLTKEITISELGNKFLEQLTPKIFKNFIKAQYNKAIPSPQSADAKILAALIAKHNSAKSLSPLTKDRATQLLKNLGINHQQNSIPDDVVSALEDYLVDQKFAIKAECDLTTPSEKKVFNQMLYRFLTTKYPQHNKNIEYLKWQTEGRGRTFSNPLISAEEIAAIVHGRVPVSAFLKRFNLQENDQISQKEINELKLMLTTTIMKGIDSGLSLEEIFKNINSTLLKSIATKYPAFKENLPEKLSKLGMSKEKTPTLITGETYRNYLIEAQMLQAYSEAPADNLQVAAPVSIAPAAIKDPQPQHPENRIVGLGVKPDISGIDSERVKAEFTQPYADALFESSHYDILEKFNQSLAKFNSRNFATSTKRDDALNLLLINFIATQYPNFKKDMAEILVNQKGLIKPAEFIKYLDGAQPKSMFSRLLW